MRKIYFILIVLVLLFSCKKKDTSLPIPDPLLFLRAEVDNRPPAPGIYDVRVTPVLKLFFNNVIDRQSVPTNVALIESGAVTVPVNYSYERNDSIIVLAPQLPLLYLTQYNIRVNSDLQSVQLGKLANNIQTYFFTSIDSSDKFPVIPDNQLLDTVQRRTFRYFWEFGHPVSGMSRERNSSGDLVTSGGTGFGIMSIVAAVNRNFITRTEGRDRILKISNFLINNCTRYHGAFAHWINGATGSTIPFSTNDNGADLVETSYLINGLLTAREYFKLISGIKLTVYGML